MSTVFQHVDVHALHTAACTASTAAPWWAIPAATLVVGAGTLWFARHSIQRSSANAQAAINASGQIARDQIEAATGNAKRQTQANVISTNRQRWIDAVREDVAALLAAEVTHAALSVKAYKAGHESEAWEKMDLNLAQIYMLRSRLELRLNPDKPLHIDLLSAIEAMFDKMGGENDEEARNVVVAAKRLLKGEWERVKREATGDFPVSSAAEL